MSVPERPTVIFVPGGWHPPDCFHRVGEYLNEAGYITDYVSLPSVGPEHPYSDLDADIARIRNHISHAVEAGQDVMLVTHSYSSIPAQDAVKGLDKTLRSRAGNKGGVCHLYFCSASIMDEGQSIMTVSGGQIPPWWHKLDDEKSFPVSPEETFYHDLDEVQAKLAAAKLKPHSLKVGLGVVRDRALPLTIQKMMVQQIAGGAGVHFNTQTIDSGHCPFYSMPEELSKGIRRAVGEQT